MRLVPGQVECAWLIRPNWMTRRAGLMDMAEGLLFNSKVCN